jgi:hypothetical protein
MTGRYEQVEVITGVAGVAIGRKNWLFAGSDSGGERAAVVYSLVETCKLNGIDPEAGSTDAYDSYTCARTYQTSGRRDISSGVLIWIIL